MGEDKATSTGDDRLSILASGQHPVVLSADWAKPRGKRAVWVALGDPGTSHWRIQREPPPQGGWNLSGLLAKAQQLRAERSKPVLIGVDAVIGLPRGFVDRAGFSSFADGLAHLQRSGALDEESPQWSTDRPFFRVVRGGLRTLIDSAGGDAVFLREIERLTGGNTVFAISGIPGSVGGGSRSLWKELTALWRTPTPEVSVWPFDGDLTTLLSASAPVLAETYPAAAYGVALANGLPTPRLRLGKSRRDVRDWALRELRNAPWRTSTAIDIEDLTRAVENEDDFDALLTAAALIRLIAEGHPLASDPVDPAVEGGILGTGGVDLSRRVSAGPRGDSRSPFATRLGEHQARWCRGHGFDETWFDENWAWVLTEAKPRPRGRRRSQAGRRMGRVRRMPPPRKPSGTHPQGAGGRGERCARCLPAAPAWRSFAEPRSRHCHPGDGRCRSRSAWLGEVGTRSLPAQGKVI